MFTLKPPPWYLKSTINNISLIQRFRKKQVEKMSLHEIIFQFWLDYFSDAIEEKVEDSDQIRFPVSNLSYKNAHLYKNYFAGLNNEIMKLIVEISCRF